MAQDFIPGTLAIHECFFPYRKIPYFTGNNSSWIDIPRAASEFSGATLSLVHVNIPHCPCLARINRIPSSCLEKIKKNNLESTFPSNRPVPSAPQHLGCLSQASQCSRVQVFGSREFPTLSAAFAQSVCCFPLWKSTWKTLDLFLQSYLS